MKYVRLSTLLVVLTVALAGCSGGGVTDGSENGTEAATGSPSSSGDSASSDGLSLTEADERLRDAGSFTTEWSYSVTEADGTTASITDTYRVDLDANRSVELFSTTGPDSTVEIETFVADGTVYSRYGGGQEPFYNVNDQAPDVFDSATGRASSFYGSLESDAQFVGTETFDGVTVSRYEYDDTAAWQTYNGATGSSMFGSDNVTVTDFTVSVLVDENDVARLTMWTFSGRTDAGQSVSAEWRYSLTDIGSTTVSDPSWLAEAQAQQS
ncbi:hypothetical protein NDI56_14675 [Haloarcula sp. S1CR25-12]|uniref:Lipoprotein n=1 Tax=Haloarcula saliterrae TaxID=2950534 RepID=A0ABU2FEG2_9EURY|nr:hypothetical protein [Haloarcula sp. S1CR25-12]MDS0260648.1 hypothetical protein [Haloarcula sp. S1CR25-12]